MSNYLLALDQGTTSSRAILFDRKGQILGMEQAEFQQYYPQPGWVEHDANEIWETQYRVVLQLLEKTGIPLTEIAAAGITNQRETTVVWNRHTGVPVYKAIVWQDRRTAPYCHELKAAGKEEELRHKTGLVADAYFSATKIRWILDQVPGARDLAAQGDLLFGTINTWLLWKLTQGAIHATDVSNASRTLLYNIFEKRWDPALMELFGVPAVMLPEVKASSGHFGTAQVPGLEGLMIGGMAGDQQAALFGQCCFEPGMVKNTYGTGCFMVWNTGATPVLSTNQLLTTVAWQVGDRFDYALEGSVFIAGAVVQWLRDGLGFIETSQQVEALAMEVEDADGVYVVPAFAGLGAPYWNQEAKGTIVGLTRGTRHAHMARAALDSIAYQTLDVVKAMEADTGAPIAELRVDGGASTNNALMQFQSDVMQSQLVRPKTTETTALGVAFLAGLACGYYENMDAIKSLWEADRTFQPVVPEATANKWYSGWKRAVSTALHWATHQDQDV